MGLPGEETAMADEAGLRFAGAGCCLIIFRRRTAKLR